MKAGTINNIELSSLCNLACVYCPSHRQGAYRKVGIMSEDVFRRAIEWARLYASNGTQTEINLFGVGEPLLNKNIVQFVEIARRELPWNQDLHINTNGLLLTEDLAKALKHAGITAIDVTCHDAYHSAKALKILRKVGVPHRPVFDFITSPNNWGGQSDWFEPDYRFPCPWLTKGQITVFSNGDVTTCCMDAFGQGIVGNVFETDPDAIYLEPFNLCRTCHQRPDNILNMEERKRCAN